MTRPGRARAVVAALLLTGVVGAVPVVPAQARAAAADPPALPQVTEGCVGESPAVVDSPPWALRRMLPSAVWPLTRGEGVVVAVVDTGVSATATALRGAVRAGTDVVGSGAADRDCYGRGTALAGIVAARPVTGSGFVGMAPEATILPIRIVDAKGKVAPGAIAAGIRAATAAKADVILLGVGTTSPDAELRAAIREAVGRDIVLVAAVSDETKPTGSTQRAAPWFPAAHPDVVAVGGIDAKGVPTEKSPPEAGVDLLAPAAGAVSVAPRGNGHYSVAGPAVAAAYAAGAAALIRAHYPKLSQADVRRRLELSAEHPLGTWPAPGVGYGTLDLYNALNALELDRTPLPSQPQVLRPLPAAAPAEPTKLIAGSVAAGMVGLAGLAYLSAMTVKWGRRRRWRA
ncbi:S8 family serine peptidase [Micromonospora avicenniae]|uniref:Type VII secretion-associated serine protease mycosin n=1 Tax=Micromonospora avicenniae TaxID=1198245 RepID=A0A1N6VMS5_9ACTN|nr:S8 family serine peptidase [Micromonospora avicenniae]SIQ79107.1 type VII secretion-associated serine protease mycosin [Micromonospora avicenniae]